MRFKKTKEQKPSRNPNLSRSQPVFSYYSRLARPESVSNNLPKRSMSGQVGGNKQKGLKTQNLIKYSPSILALVMVVVCGFYALSLSTTPRLILLNKEQSMITDKALYKQQISNILSSSLANRSKVLIDTEKIADKIKKQFPEFSDVSVVIPLVGRSPLVEINQSEPVALINSGTQTYAIDKAGVAIYQDRQIPSSIRNKLIVIQDQAETNVELGQSVIPKDYVKFITEVHAQLANRGLKEQSITLPNIPHELHITLQGSGYYTKFDLKGDARLQAGSYLAVIGKLSKDGVAPSQYIDVRVPGRVFYK